MNALVVDKRLVGNGKTVSFKPDLVGLLVFGGVDPVTNYSKFYDVYAMAFSTENNRAAWAFVVVAPLTRHCLQSDKVIHSSESDPQGKCSTNKLRVQIIMLATYWLQEGRRVTC